MIIIIDDQWPTLTNHWPLMTLIIDGDQLMCIIEAYVMTIIVIVMTKHWPANVIDRDPLCV